MVIVMPKNIDGLSKIEKYSEKFTNDYLDKHGENSKTDLYLPKFKIQSYLDISTPHI